MGCITLAGRQELAERMPGKDALPERTGRRVGLHRVTYQRGPRPPGSSARARGRLAMPAVIDVAIAALAVLLIASPLLFTSDWLPPTSPTRSGSPAISSM